MLTLSPERIVTGPRSRLAVRVLEHALANFWCQPQPADTAGLKRLIWRFKPANDVNPVLIVIESRQVGIDSPQQLVQCVFAGVPEWSVANVVCKCSCLDEILVQPEGCGDSQA